MQPKKISYASGNENPNKFPIFQEMGTLKKLLIFQEMELFSPLQENYLCFREQKPRKNFLYYPQKKTVHMFQETEGPTDLFIYFGCI